VSIARGERTRVAVVGGGIAGLALGFELVRRGANARVLEAGPRPGGNIRSERRGGYLCEWGPNGFLDNEPATLQLVDALGLRDELAPAGEAAHTRWIVRGGRLRSLPLSPAKFLTSDVLSVSGRLRVLCEWAQPARRDASDESVWDFARRRIGREAADVLVDAMVTGIYAGDPRRLSLEGAFPRMRTLEREHGGLFRGMRAQRAARRAAGAANGGAAGGPLGPGGTLTSFRGGMETIVQALSRALGSNLVVNARVARLDRQGTLWRLELENGAPMEAEHVVLACPSWQAAPLVRALDHELGDWLDAIPSAPVAVVCIGWKEADVQAVPRGFGFLVPGRERLGILGTLYDTWVFPDRSEPGTVLWRTMIGGARERGAIDLDDGALVERALRAYAKLLGLHATPHMTAVVRHLKGIPQYPVGHVERLGRIEDRLQRHPGLLLAGNSYRGVAMNSCIKEAATLAARFATDTGAGAKENA
jgi:oxygen-dependent protoporphyrinogen oxidase